MGTLETLNTYATLDGAGDLIGAINNPVSAAYDVGSSVDVEDALEGDDDFLVDAADEGLGGADEFASRTPLDTTIDFIWSGHQDDEIDVLGPTVFGTDGSVLDVVTETEGESTEGETGTKLLLVAVVVAVFLFLLGPVFEVIAALLGGADA